jgi:dethiobiotin synthetase
VSLHPAPLQPPPAGYFITGTDTGVGKTLVACALLRAYGARGVRAAGMKPVAAGAVRQGGRLVNEDVTALARASAVAAPHDLVNPYCFEEPIAPHIAAAAAGVSIEIGRIDRALRALLRLCELVVVEGAGGFRVPLGPAHDTSQLARALALPVVVVVGMRLGCLNHALLTADAVLQAGLPLAGWVANHVERDMPYADENVQALRERMPAPLVARIPYLESGDSARAAHALDLACLHERLARA